MNMNFYETEENQAYKPITENPITINLSNCRNVYDIHAVLKEKFGLPEYYGENWDALWDCLSDIFGYEDRFVVNIFGFFTLKDDLIDYCKPMLELFKDLHSKAPNVIFTLIS